MKQRIATLLIACGAMTMMNPSAGRAQPEISASIQINSPTDFDAPLTPYGSWVTVGSYGRCWHPTHIESDWQPYTVGYWEWTDAGWYWHSDEPWAWACYHYGSWYDQPSVGWVWIPGTDWAPAWVTWRSSDDYIGWAPCGPGRSVLAAPFFTFCDVHHFRDHFNRRNLIVNNTTIINRTKVVGNFQRRTVDFDGRQRTIYSNQGPGVDRIQRATGAKFTPRPVRDVVRETRRPENIRRDDNRRPEQKPAEQPRRETPAPTGRDQQRNYQQPPNAHSPTPQRPALPEQKALPPQRTPEPAKPDVIPPTGREQPRVYREAPKEVPKPNPGAEQRREVPTPAPRPVTPPQKILPPTGRDEAPRLEHREAPAQAPALRPAPPVQQAPDGGHERDGNKDH